MTNKDPTAVNEEQTKKKEQNRGSRETQNIAFGSPVVEVRMNHNCRTSATNSNTHILRTRSDESSLWEGARGKPRLSGFLDRASPYNDFKNGT